jgi:hypothetical protein
LRHTVDVSTSETNNRDFAEKHMNIVLGRLAGPDASPRSDQVDAVHAVLQPASRVLVVQATGWGKSAVYWAATHALRHSGAGPTLVVSPLLALMRDQVSAAERAGLSAATVNSTNFDEWDEVFRQLDNDTLDVLLVSPERLGNARFAARLGELLARVGLIVIDEAHCISDWGFDFRPDYQRLARALLSTPTASVLATTATANERVTKDVSDQLGVDTVTYRGTLARTSLTLSVVPGLSPLERYAWIADALEQLPGSGIIYVLTVAEADKLAAFLASCGHNVDAYTGQLDGDSRIAIEERLRNNEIKAVIATSALGMGYPILDFVYMLALHQHQLRITNKLVVRDERLRMPMECCCHPMRMNAFGTISQLLPFPIRSRPTKCWRLFPNSHEHCWKLKAKPVCVADDLKHCSRYWRLKVLSKRLVRRGGQRANVMCTTPQSGRTSRKYVRPKPTSCASTRTAKDASWRSCRSR